MSKGPDAPPGEPTRDDIHQYVGVLPIVGPASIINEQAATAACFDISRADPALARRIGEQVAIVTAEVAGVLDRVAGDSERYSVTPDELRGIVAKAMLRIAGQFALDIGQALGETADLEDQLRVHVTGEVND